MKLKIKQRLIDKETKETLEPEMVIERSSERAKTLIELGFAEEIKEKSAPKEEKKEVEAPEPVDENSQPEPAPEKEAPKAKTKGKSKAKKK